MTLLSGIEITILGAAVFYCAVVLGLAVGMGRLRYTLRTHRPFVSVVVAARNEEQTLERLIQDLQVQNYPSFEIIVVNDRSMDRTGEIISKFQINDPRIKRIDIALPSKTMPAKKHALSAGIAASNGEILCFTDADCAPPPLWISSLVSAFDEGVGLVAGYSPYISGGLVRHGSVFQSLLQSFIRYEEFKGATWAAGSIGLQRAWLCTGRSLAYRRIVFDEVGGFKKIEHSISGDDDLFLQLVRRTTQWQIRYATAPESFVPTSPPGTFREFVRQRTRHFSAGKFFPFGMKAFFFAFHTTNLALLLFLIEGLVSGRLWQAIIPFGLKCLADTLLFARSAAIFQRTDYASSFLVHEILYILYNTFIGPLGFVATFQWKQENSD